MVSPRRRAERSALEISQLCIYGNNIHDLILHHVALFHVTVQHVIGHNLILKQVSGVALRAPLLWNKIITAKEEA
jgi:hypothetical protein